MVGMMLFLMPTWTITHPFFFYWPASEARDVLFLHVGSTLLVLTTTTNTWPQTTSPPRCSSSACSEAEPHETTGTGFSMVPSLFYGPFRLKPTVSKTTKEMSVPSWKYFPTILLQCRLLKHAHESKKSQFKRKSCDKPIRVSAIS